jgi:hypothetical protein
VCAGCRQPLFEAGSEAAAFATLRLQEGALRREDYCAPCFNALAARPVTFWKRAASPRSDREAEKPQSRRRRDTHTLVELFDRLVAAGRSSGAESGGPSDSQTGPGDGVDKLRYLLALALVRRRKLELIDMAREGDADRLTLKRSGHAELISIVSPTIADDEREQLLLQLLNAM